MRKVVLSMKVQRWSRGIALLILGGKGGVKGVPHSLYPRERAPEPISRVAEGEERFWTGTGEKPPVFPYLLSPWSRVLLEKLTGYAASQEIPRIFGTRRFVTVLTSVRPLSIS